MGKVICVCKCSGQDEKAKAAFSLLFKDEKLPPLLVGRSKILTLTEQHPNTPISAQAHALAHNRGKFAHYYEYDENGSILTHVNLITGNRLA